MSSASFCYDVVCSCVDCVCLVCLRVLFVIYCVAWSAFVCVGACVCVCDAVCLRVLCSANKMCAVLVCL